MVLHSEDGFGRTKARGPGFRGMHNVNSLLYTAQQLGKIVQNLLSIELGARMAIDKLDIWKQGRAKTPLPLVTTGQWVDIDVYTNDNDLNQTLERYNKFAPDDLKVDVKQIVALRDAIAHGRQFGIIGSDVMRLVKFGKERRNNQVETLLAVDLAPEWFLPNLAMLSKALDKIGGALGYEKREFGALDGETAR